MEIEEVVNIVGDLNQSFFDKTNEVDFSPFTLKYDLSIQVEYMGINIWSECDDCRDYVEETDEYEPLEPFLLRRAKRVHDTCAAMFA